MRKLMMVAVLTLCFTVSAFAADVNISWDGAGAEAEGAVGYRIYYGQTSHSSVTQPDGPFIATAPFNASPYDQVIDVPGGGTRSVHHVLSAGTWFFRATAYDDAGNESPFNSTEPVLVLLLAAPVNLTISVLP